MQMPDIKNKKVLTYEEYERAKQLKKDAFKEKDPETKDINRVSAGSGPSGQCRARLPCQARSAI